MPDKINKIYELKAQEEIEEFIDNNEDTLKILDAITPQVTKHFPNTKLSLETCSKLGWTTETKLLLNIHVTEEMFFNSMLNHMNTIYKEIEPLIQDILCPIILFPKLQNEKYEKLDNNSAINLIARTAYFNNDTGGIIKREMTIREIPKEQQVREIKEYCEVHPNPKLSDLLYDLQLDLIEADAIIDELEEEGFKLNVEY